MSTLRQAAQQALEALEQRDNATLWHQAIHALRDALAQEEQAKEWFKEVSKQIPRPMQQWPSREWQRGCQVCGIGAHGETMGYVCPRSDCPTRITCGGAI